MNKPYFYKIKNKTTGKYYVGSQYGRTANKENFFVNYFTSSQKIENIIISEGVETFEIVCIKERDDARNYEVYYLNKCYRLLGRDKFLSLFYNRSLSPGILLDDAIIEKQTVTKKKRWSDGTMDKPVPPNWKGKSRSAHMRKKLSESKLGHTVSEDTKQKLRKANLGKVQTVETKEKRAQSLSKNKNAYGKKHWLFISPDGKYHYTIGKRNQRLHELGLSEGPGFINYCNTGNTPLQGKNVGWVFYEGEDKIKNLLKTANKENIIYYE
jgi:hypothetical protein